jgi:hypothetical protein
VQAPHVEATAALTVVVVGLLTVPVDAHGSALQVPQTVEELLHDVGSALQVPQVVEELVEAGSALQVPQVVEELVEVAFAGSALQVPQVEELVEAAFLGSALHTLQVPVELAALPELKLPVADLQVELVQVPKFLPKVYEFELARASAPKVNATAVVNFILIIENIGCQSRKRE